MLSTRTTRSPLRWLLDWHPAEIAPSDLGDAGGSADPLPPAPAGAPVPEPAQQAQVARDTAGRFASPSTTDTAVQQAATQLGLGDPQQQTQPQGNPWDGKTPEEIWRNGESFKADLDKVKQATKDWREVSNAVGPDVSAAFVDLARAWALGDTDRLAHYHAQIGEALAATGAQPQGQPSPQGQAPAQIPVGPDGQVDVQALVAQVTEHVRGEMRNEFSQRDQKAAMERATAEVRSLMTGLSSEVGIPALGDPSTWQYQTVLSMAQSTAGETPQERLRTAAQTFRDEIAKEGQALLATKRNQTGAPATPANGAAPAGRQEPKDFGTARQSAEERLRHRESSPGT